MEADVLLDCYGLLCPMPIVKTAEKIKQLQIGQSLAVLSTDEGIKTDMPAWCKATGQKFLGVEEADGAYKAYIKKLK